jgi:hypothetical protein
MEIIGRIIAAKVKTEAEAPESPEILPGEGDGVLSMLVRVDEYLLGQVARALRTQRRASTQRVE